MIERKPGEVNNVIYKNTVYNEGSNIYFPTIQDTQYIISKLIRVRETPNFLRFNPFYINSRLNRQIEFDEHMFYLECRTDFTEDDFQMHLYQCVEKKVEDMSSEELSRAKILYPLCKVGDVESFSAALLAYKDYLNKQIPSLFAVVRKKLDLIWDDAAFGFFCFEIHSN